jgi:hypothetical protein
MSADNSLHYSVNATARRSSIIRTWEEKLRPIDSITRSFGLLLLTTAISLAQSPPPNEANAVPVNPAAPSQQAPPISDDHILGIIPNFQTVNDPSKGVTPLTAKQKFELFARETVDPFTIIAGAAGAGISQGHNDDPKYGQGGGAYAQRFGAAVTDITTQNFFSDFMLSSLLHEDPRYFRRGPRYHFWYRVGYSLSRLVVTQTDSGKARFNYSNIGGIAMGIGLSNAYYPDKSVNVTEVASRFGTSLVASALANILPEFWPDMKQKFFHHK